MRPGIPQHLFPNLSIPRSPPILIQHGLSRQPRILHRTVRIPNGIIRQRRESVRNVHEALKAFLAVQAEEFFRHGGRSGRGGGPVVEMGLQGGNTGQDGFGVRRRGTSRACAGKMETLLEVCLPR